MIRFVYIGEQIIDGSRDFAFFDTVRDKFISLDGKEVFGSIHDLEEAWELASRKKRNLFHLERMISLIKFSDIQVDTLTREENGSPRVP